MKTIHHLLLAAFATSFCTYTLRAQVPQLINYQGRITVGTTNFNSPPNGQFKFALVNATGSTVFWTNSPDVAPADGMPDTAVSRAVTNGLYSVLLGDTSIAGMTQAIPASVWSNPDVRLRVWFNDGTTGFQLLAPDQRLAPNGYLPDGSVSSAAVAGSAITSAKLASGAVTSSKIGAGAVGSTHIASGAITGIQLSNTLELGGAAADGSLRLWDNATNLQTIQLAGGSSAISILGTDGLVQARLRDNSAGFVVPLGDPFGGVLELYDAASENNRTVLLGAHEAAGTPNPGGVLRLAHAEEEEVYLKAHSSGGLFQLRRSDGFLTVEVRAEEATTAGGSIETRSATGVSQFLLFNDTTEGGAEMQLKGPTGVANMVFEARDSTGEGAAITLRNAANITTVRLKADDTAGSGGHLRLHNDAGAGRISIEASENGTDGGQIIIYNSANQPALTLDAEHGAGSPSRVITGTVEITGGSDLSEQFNIHPAIGQAPPEPGMIVCIDPSRPGELRTSATAYDRTVAGIISGAGGVRPGMLMGQQGSVADGAHPVALSGRVYCYVDTTANGAIAPGDLITTSGTPGHGMKVTDHDQARGAIIGKAMTGLAEGAGLVLVLVSLQ